jgi:hypothetical protein
MDFDHISGRLDFDPGPKAFIVLDPAFDFVIFAIRQILISDFDNKILGDPLGLRVIFFLVDTIVSLVFLHEILLHEVLMDIRVPFILKTGVIWILPL